MAIIRVDTIELKELLPYKDLTDRELRLYKDNQLGIFIAESPKVINVALNAGYSPISLLCEEKHIYGDAADIISRCPKVPVYTGKREILSKLTGYKLTRGVLCAMKRKILPTAEELFHDKNRIAVIDGVSDTTNIGAIFRSAAALGIEAIALTPTACDPLNRRASRVSMGSVFLIPWTRIESPVGKLKQLGYKIIALALKEDSISLDDPILQGLKKTAIVLGTEGDGLADTVIEESDYNVKIPMSHNVDSLNVAAAAAVAFWQLRFSGQE